MSRVYKSRYYLEGSFFSAKFGGNLSYVWRNIIETQSLLKKGTSCRIRRGDKIFVLNEPWLPDLNDPYVSSANSALQNVKVASLMDISANQWDQDLVIYMFNERDADLILSIPVNSTDNDTWY